MHMTTASRLSHSPIVTVRWAVHLNVTVRGSARRRQVPAVEPAVDELPGAEIVAIDLGDSIRRCSPSPSTTQQPVGHGATRTVREVRSWSSTLDADVAAR